MAAESCARSERQRRHCLKKGSMPCFSGCDMRNGNVFRASLTTGGRLQWSVLSVRSLRPEGSSSIIRFRIIEFIEMRRRRAFSPAPQREPKGKLWTTSKQISHYKDGPFPRLYTMKYSFNILMNIHAMKNLSETLLKDAKRVVRSFQEAKGWATGTLDLKITTH